MDKLSCFSLSIENHVAHLVLNRPEAMNTMGPTFWKELDAVLKHLHRAGEARALVISSTGKSLQRHASAKVPAGAADHQRPRRALLVQLRQHGIELAPEQRVHGVELGWPVQHQVSHVVLGSECEAMQGVIHG